MGNKILISFLVTGVLIVGIVFVTNLSNQSTQEKSVANVTYQLAQEKLEEMPTISSFANYKIYDDLDALEEDAELIIIATATAKFTDREHINEYHDVPDDPYQTKVLVESITKTEINIEAVLKQPEDEQLKKGDIISIIEPVAIFEDLDNIKKKATLDNYKEISESNSYVLFLKKNTDGEYSIINMNNGRFTVNAADEFITAKAQRQDPEEKEGLEKHEEIKQSIFERYKKELETVN